MNKKIYTSVFSSIISICMFSNYISYNMSASAENIENYNNTNLENELFSDDEVIDGQYIVVTNDKISDDIESAQLTSEITNLDYGMYVINLNADDMINIINDENITSLEEDFIISANSVNCDNNRYTVNKYQSSTHPKQNDYEWNIQAINAENLSEEIETQDKVKIAILDSGVDRISNVDVADSICLVSEESQITPMFEDMTGHGTAIASIIAGDGEDGIRGINPNAEIYSVKVLDKNNTAPVSRIIEGIYWCIDNDIDIINMSFGTNRYSPALEQAVKAAYNSGILMIGAAGNNAGDVEYPAAFDEVMAVGSVNPEAQISDFSNTGEELEIAAPGEKIKASGFFCGTIVTHGTSISVPHVVGVASLLWEKDTSKSNEFIRQLINYSAKNIENTDECGLVDANYALCIYDVFVDNFDNKLLTVNDLVIPENNQDPTKFESINEDENYVEGLWKGEDHKQPISDVYEGLNISTDDVTVIKLGAVYPDIADELQTATPHPQWHGYYEGCNYIGCYQLVQRIGKGAGNIDSYTNNNPIPGLSQYDYLKIKNCFGKNSETFCGKSYASIINSVSLYDEYDMSTEAGRKQAARYSRKSR